LATIFSHAIVAGALGQAGPDRYRGDWRFWYLLVICAIIPDADVASRWFGIRYEDMWGHRGITHSLFFALILGGLAAARFRPHWRKDGWKLAALFFAVTASHGLLDALTNGGRGIAFFAPFDRVRYFFPWRPIEVSPIGASRFLTLRGQTVILSELKWIWPPSILIGWSLFLVNRRHPASG